VRSHYLKSLVDDSSLSCFPFDITKYVSFPFVNDYHTDLADVQKGRSLLLDHGRERWTLRIEIIVSFVQRLVGCTFIILIFFFFHTATLSTLAVWMRISSNRLNITSEMAMPPPTTHSLSFLPADLPTTPSHPTSTRHPTWKNPLSKHDLIEGSYLL
jgi:hypothetical protein